MRGWAAGPEGAVRLLEGAHFLESNTLPRRRNLCPWREPVSAEWILQHYCNINDFLPHILNAICSSSIEFVPQILNSQCCNIEEFVPQAQHAAIPQGGIAVLKWHLEMRLLKGGPWINTAECVRSVGIRKAECVRSVGIRKAECFKNRIFT